MKTVITILTLLFTGLGSLHAQKPAFDGMTKNIGYDKMITPLGIEVTFNKTVHILFQSRIKYVDLGSANLIAGKADATENVLRIKAAVENFTGETNFSVVCENGDFYTFNARYAKEPELLSVEITDLLQRRGIEGAPNKITAGLSDLGDSSPALVDLILKTIYRNNDRNIRHLGCMAFGVQTTIKGFYINDGLLYVHVQVRNTSNIPFTVDFTRFKVVDKKLVKRTATQEKVIQPLRSFNEEIEIGGKSTARVVFALPKFTLPDDNILMLDITEKDGGRHQSVRMESTDLLLAKTISKLKTN